VPQGVVMRPLNDGDGIDLDVAQMLHGGQGGIYRQPGSARW